MGTSAQMQAKREKEKFVVMFLQQTTTTTTVLKQGHLQFEQYLPTNS